MMKVALSFSSVIDSRVLRKDLFKKLNKVRGTNPIFTSWGVHMPSNGDLKAEIERLKAETTELKALKSTG